MCGKHRADSVVTHADILAPLSNANATELQTDHASVALDFIYHAPIPALSRNEVVPESSLEITVVRQRT